jgi:hypothetical protein
VVCVIFVTVNAVVVVIVIAVPVVAQIGVLVLFSVLESVSVSVFLLSHSD